MPRATLERDVTQPYVRNPELVPVFQRIYDDPAHWWDAYDMCEKLIDVEESFQLWRFRHMKTVERIIGYKTGTGGSSGVGFLRRALEHAFFPGADRRAHGDRRAMTRRHADASLTDDRAARVAALRPGRSTEAALAAHVAPLFSRALAAAPGRIYLANHSLGRPLDATDDDVREGLAAWYAQMGGAWDAWMCRIAGYRERIARMLGAPRADCVVPKTSAGQGLRAILNTFDARARASSRCAASSIRST